MFAQQYLAGLQQVSGFAVVQANGADVRLQTVQAQGQNARWGMGHSKQPPRGFVHPHIGGLGAEQDSGEQLEHARILQLRIGLRIGRFQGGKKRLDLVFFHGFNWGQIPINFLW